jgi:type IV pilus assembly protein PilB
MEVNCLEHVKRRRLGDLLIDVGLVSKEQLEMALEEQKKSGEKLGEVLVGKGFVTEQNIIQVLEFQLGIPHVDLDKYQINSASVNLISESIAKRHGIIPINHQNDVITLAMSDPMNVFAIDDVKIYTGMEVQPVIVSMEAVKKAIGKYYGSQQALKAVEEFKKEKSVSIGITNSEADEKQNEEINNAPAVKLVNSIFEQALRSRASDIHIEPFEKYLKVRFRIDGKLYEIMRAEVDIVSAISSRIKIIGGMNIAEKRAPQDGRITITIADKVLDLRVSILPTVYGEKIVLRVVDKKSFVIKKEELGFTKSDQTLFENMLKNPHGIILVTGPTGSGKSTTLYSAINEINSPDINIITIEDPVEALIEGVNQVNINSKSGLTFAAGLRSVLRQDPNVIMIGEIRDNETAEIAVRAAITGHLVLSTLHTNDAPGAILRLIDMGIEPFLASSSIVGVIAQRLIRMICKNCKVEYKPKPDELEFLRVKSPDDVKLFRGRGCAVCSGTGYKGRQGIYEVMMITKTHREMINRDCAEEELRQVSIDIGGMITLSENARTRVLDGSTTLEEMIRVTYSE